MTDKQDLEARIKAVEAADLEGLQQEYQALFGVEPVTKNVKALRGQITRKLQRNDIDAWKKAGKEEAETPATATPAPQKSPKPQPAPESDTTVLKRIAELQGLSVPQLRERYERFYGRTCSSRNKRFLLKKIAEAVRHEVGTQAGKVTVTAKFERKGSSRSKNTTREKKATGEAKPQQSTATVRDPRLPKPGTVIERVYKGKTLRVTVTETGFEYQGKPYRSLSALAMAITGAKAMNGFLFFKLGQYAEKEQKSK